MHSISVYMYTYVVTSSVTQHIQYMYIHVHCAYICLSILYTSLYFRKHRLNFCDTVTLTHVASAGVISTRQLVPYYVYKQLFMLLILKISTCAYCLDFTVYSHITHYLTSLTFSQCPAAATSDVCGIVAKARCDITSCEP